MTDEEVRLLRRLRDDIESLLRDGGLTIGLIMERLMELDRFYKHDISVGRLHVFIQLMARLYNRDFCRTHKSSTKLFLRDHPRPPMPIRPVTARTGHTRASRAAEAVERLEERSYGDFTAAGKLSRVLIELKHAADRYNRSDGEDPAATVRLEIMDPIIPVRRAVPVECDPGESGNPEDGSPIKSGMTDGSSIESGMTRENGGQSAPRIMEN